jgi:heme-degrading monooxygenase HmoA
MLRIESKASRRALVALSVILAGCGAEKDPQSEGGDAACNHGVMEADLEAQPPSGPGVDPETGKILLPPSGSSYVVSTTYGVPKPGEAVRERWGQLFAGIQEQLASQEGFLAVVLTTSPSCGSGRTLAVWTSEEAMYEFVTSPAHAEAMAASDEVLQSGTAVDHWEATKAEEMTLEEAVRRLAAKGATEY